MAEENATISVPLPLYNQLKEKIKGTEFKSVSDYAVFVLTELVAEDEDREITKEDEEKIKSRLRSLGYLD